MEVIMNKNIDKIVMGGLFIAIGAILPQLFHIAQDRKSVV